MTVKGMYMSICRPTRLPANHIVEVKPQNGT